MVYYVKIFPLCSSDSTGRNSIKQPTVSKPIVVCFTITEIGLYLTILVMDLSARNRDTRWLKYTGILLCLSFALLCALRGGDRLPSLALLLTAGADWFLLIQTNHLLPGVILFLCVQTLYFLRLHRSGGHPNFLWGRLALALVFTLSPLLIPGMNTALNFTAMLYFSQLVSNAVLAWTIPSMRLFALGLTLFTGCDLCVGLFNAVPLPPAVLFIVSAGMWVFYLPSQILIALSALPKEATGNENK